MENKMNIFEKLSAIQNELKAPKKQFNKFGNYNYRSCEDILEAVKPICQKYKTTLVISDELVVLGDNNPISYTETYYDKELENTRTIVACGERYYIKATATLYDFENETQILNTAYAREEETKKGMDGSQITGASSSYARKYALNGLFAIDDTKDSDTTNKGDEKPTPNIKKQDIDFDKVLQNSIKKEPVNNEIKQTTLKNAGDFIFPFGKHKGKSIKQIYEEDKKEDKEYSYLDWCMDADFVKQDIKDLIAQFLNDVNTGYDPELEEVEIDSDEQR